MSLSIDLQGAALSLVRYLVSEQLTDVQRVELRGNLARVDFPESNFVIRLDATDGHGRQVLWFSAAVREPAQGLGTWSCEWPVTCERGCRAGELVVVETSRSRLHFRRLLAERSAQDCSVAS